jgi:hypothetical protein
MTRDMGDSAFHLQDDQLLLYASGERHELSPELISHAQSCSQCRARSEQLENAFEEFTQSQRIALNAALPCAAGPRALLKAHLANLAVSPTSASTGFSLLNWRRALVVAPVFAALAFATIFLALGNSHRARTAQDLSLPDEPDARFTPGAVIAATRSQICSVTIDEPPPVPAALKAKVLQLYGVSGSHDDAYEVDYLVTPQLGGATDVRNLWPEPYHHTEWNARVKDRLENKLRDMVCHGDIDLATAQHDISTDWIAAYRKYFHATQPVLTGSS